MQYKNEQKDILNETEKNYFNISRIILYCFNKLLTQSPNVKNYHLPICLKFNK